MPHGSSVPRVTVAIPSFNQGRFLEATLRSIFAQPVPLEVMLADGGSTDNTLHIIERWQHRLRWFRTGRDAGQAAAINEAISHGQAPFVCWLNSDDIFLPGGLSNLVKAIESDVSTAVAYGDCLRLDERGRVIGRYQVSSLTTVGLSRRCVIAQPASIIRREAWERAGGLDESLHLSPDYDLWWRLHRMGARFNYVDVEIAAARLHPAAKTIRQASEMYAEAQSVVRHHHGSLPLIWWLRRPLSIGMRKMRKWQCPPEDGAPARSLSDESHPAARNHAGIW
jgi:glycosyltransferase involved in cell wall biosynthesis